MARRRKAKKSNNLTYYIIGGLVLVLVLVAFPNIGLFTATLTDSGVEIIIITPEQDIVKSGDKGIIKLVFKNVQDFDTLTFKTYSPGIWLHDIEYAKDGPLTYSNTNAVIGSAEPHGTNITTLNFEGITGTDIDKQTIYLIFTTNWGSGSLSEIVISDILFGDSDGDAIASFSNISRHDVVPVNLPPTVRINSPSAGSSWPHNQTVTFNLSISDSDGTISSLYYYLDGTPYTYPFQWTAAYFRDTMNIGNHTFVVNATDNDGESTTVSRSFEVYNATVPTSAAVAVISSPSSQQTYYVGEDIFFNGSSSYSINASIVNYSWDDNTSWSYLNNWANATFTRTGPTSAGIYNIRLNVTDNNGVVGFARVGIQVSSLGDVNGDGQITGADVTASEWLSVGVNRNYATQNADTNQDSNTNSLDITGVERILLA